ncbi:MAG: exported protein of unknown function [Candidatus Saccharibacteria bacterium]|nr:exported protein of unknown function [Candidatus Saccharibacteria bacterium]
MTVWFTSLTIFNRRYALRVAMILALCVALTTTLLFGIISQPTHALAGTNSTISFQGRLLDASGYVVPDGNYNIQFKIYQDGTGTATGNPDGTLKWTENYVNNGGTSGVQVKNGYLSVNLGERTPFGTSVDWNQDTLWLSMNIAGSSTSCTTFGSSPCVSDGEMLPMKRLTASPYAINSGMLGGITSDGFIQNTTSVQTASLNISGSAQANTLQGNTSVISPLIDSTSSGTLNVGTVTASTINIATNNADHTINIGTGGGTTAQTVTIGSTTGSGGTTIQGGTGDVTITSGGATSATFSGTQVKIGDNTGTPTLLTLDSATSAPTVDSSMVGSMYYDTTLGQLQCYEAEGWGACAASPDDFITISPEYSNAVMHNTGTGTMTSDLCSDALNINDGSSSQPTICGTDETYNYYNWTSSQVTSQARSIYVTYQLPTSFKGFVSGSTSLMGRTDSSDAAVSYQVYRNNSTTGLTACGSVVSVSSGAQTTWQKGTATSTSDPATCSFAAGDSIVFKVNLTSANDANAYASTLGFAFSNH